MSELMIDTSGSVLPPRETQRIVDHVNLVWKLVGCTYCGSKEFNLFSQLTLRFTDDPKTLIAQGMPSRPCAALICGRCGDVRVIDLITIGVYPPPGQREPAPPTGPYR